MRAANPTYQMRRQSGEEFRAEGSYRYRLERWDAKRGWIVVGRYKQVDLEVVDRSARTFGGELQLVETGRSEPVAEWADGKRMPPASGHARRSESK